MGRPAVFPLPLARTLLLLLPLMQYSASTEEMLVERCDVGSNSSGARRRRKATRPHRNRLLERDSLMPCDLLKSMLFAEK
jgi:hypothetical protein